MYKTRLAGAALILTSPLVAVAAAPSPAAQASCARPTVHVTHNTTSTSAHIVHNPCHHWWIWAWGSFKDSNGALVRRSSKGQKTGTPVIEDDASVKNVLGGYGFSGPGGKIRNRQTYG